MTRKKILSMSSNKSGFSWIPRILTILLIAFISIFATDSFSSEKNSLQKVHEFLVHLAPALILIILLMIAWKRELFGGILFILLGLIMSPFVYNMNYAINNSILKSVGVILIIILPILIVGVLFIVSSGKKVKQAETKTEPDTQL